MTRPSRPIRVQLAMLVTLATFATTSCGGGGGGGGGGASTQGTNLRVTGVSVVSKNPNAGHEVVVSTTIEASEDFGPVSLLYAFLNQSDRNAGLADPRVEFSDTIQLEVGAGRREYKTQFVIPVETRVDRGWFLVPIVDPNDVIAETNEDDNLPAESSYLRVTIADYFTDTPSLAMDSVQYDDTVFLDLDLDSILGLTNPVEYFDEYGNFVALQDSSNFDFNATVVLSATGAESVPVQVFTQICIAQRQPDGRLEPLYDWDDVLVWDASRGEYGYWVNVDVPPGEPTAVPLQLLIPGANQVFVWGYNIREYYDTFLGQPDVGFLVRFQADTGSQVFYEDGNLADMGYFDALGYLDEEGNYQDLGGFVDEYADAAKDAEFNELWVELNLVKGSLGGGSSGGGGVPCEGISYEFDPPPAILGIRQANIAIDKGASAKLSELGATAALDTKVPLTLFGSTVNVLGFDAHARLLPDMGAGSTEEFCMNLSVLDQLLYAKSCDTQLVLNTNLAFTPLDFEASLTYFGVVKVTARATMEMGLQANVAVTPLNLTFEVGPYGRIGGSASFSVDLIVAEAGVRGSFTLLEQALFAIAWARLNAPVNGELAGSTGIDVVHHLKGPSGSLEVYYELGCGFWGCLDSDSATIFSFQLAAERRDILFSGRDSGSVCFQ